MSEEPQDLSVVEEGSEYALLSSANASAFALRFKTDNLIAYLQGEDAERFRADYATIREQFPTWKTDQTLAQLWDQGGYSWLASQDG